MSGSAVPVGCVEQGCTQGGVHLGSWSMGTTHVSNLALDPRPRSLGLVSESSLRMGPRMGLGMGPGMGLGSGLRNLDIWTPESGISGSQLWSVNLLMFALRSRSKAPGGR